MAQQPPSATAIFQQFISPPPRFRFELASNKVCSILSQKDQLVWIKFGSMIAYTGQFDFSREGIFEHGVGKALKEGLTSEGMTLVKATAKADNSTVYVADDGKKVMNFYLQAGESVLVNGDDVLAFEATVKWDIKMLRSVSGLMQGGLFNVQLTGPGFISVTTESDPIVLPVNGSVTTDPQNTVMWTSSLNVSLQTNIKLKALFGRSSGEELQMNFTGQGYVLVQPVEEFRNRKPKQ
ncbi:adenine phosphoribosyltransferase [Acrasis kona]|uniref:Adenine phosphoribosyltransferase n=1 Tax=Acrasis kona TaxID=1008807 RepID=A0AAW2ZH52_9EUKA